MTNPQVASPTHPHAGSTLNIAGQDVVLAYGDVQAEYDALRTSAIVVDRSHRGRMRFFGDKSGEALTGLVTNDVLSIQPGHGQYGAALSAKGRIVADLRILGMSGSFLVDAAPRAWPGFVAMVKKYVNPRVSGYRDESHALRDIGVFGPDSRRIVSGMTGIPADTLGALAPFSHVAAIIEGASITVARSSDIGVEGYELFVPFETFDVVWELAVVA